MEKVRISTYNDEFYEQETVDIYPDALAPFTYELIAGICGEAMVANEVHTHMVLKKCSSSIKS